MIILHFHLQPQFKMNYFIYTSEIKVSKQQYWNIKSIKEITFTCAENPVKKAYHS